MTVRTVHHFEDEPELVRWIPGTLLNLYWSRHPDWIPKEGNLVEHDDHLTTFELSVNGNAWTIEYRLYKNIEEFNELFPKNAKENDVAVVDLMDAHQQLPGLNVYEKAIETLGEPAVYFLTAFPGVVHKHRALDPQYVRPKPLDVAELVELLVRKLDIQ